MELRNEHTKVSYTVADLQTTNSEAISAFVKEHKQAVFQTCMGYVQAEADANDITQEVFIRAISTLSDFKEKSSLKTWLIRIAINLSLNYLRDTKKFKKHVELNSVASNYGEDTTEADFPIHQSETKKKLASAIRKLNERQRKVFVLFYYNDLSYAEISSISNISESAVESLLQRARKNMQKELKNFYQENYK